MGLKWSAAKEIAGEQKKYPYAHWWQEHEASGGVSEAWKKAIQDFEAKLGDGREGDIIQNFPFGETLPELVDAQSLNPVTGGRAAETVPSDVEINDGDRVVVAIDDGAFFAHEKLRNPANHVQVAWVWLQGAPWQGPSDLVCGRELSRADITRLIEDHTRGGHVDEEGLYRAVGLIDMAATHPQSAAMRQSHGMAVMDLLTGPGTGFRPAWPGNPRQAGSGTTHVFWVSLPPRVTHDTSGTFIPLFAMIGVHETLKRIHSLLLPKRSGGPPTRVRIAINMSYGLTAGPKDGLGLLGRYVQEQLDKWGHESSPLDFFVPAGNTRLTQSRAVVPADAGEPLFWHLPVDDPTPSFLEIWGPRRPRRPRSPQLGLSVAPPGCGAPMAMSAARDFDRYIDLVDEAEEGNVAMRAYLRWVPNVLRDERGAGRECLILVARPTRPEPSRPDPTNPERRKQRVFIRPGRWRIVPSFDGGEPIDVYVQRDDSLPGYPRRGRQSWLEDCSYVRRDPSGRLILTDPEEPGPVRRSGTFNAIAAGEGSVLVSGKRRLFVPDQHQGPDADSLEAASDAPFSALGREDAWGWAEGSPARPYLTVAGARSGSRVQVQGTSFAAPQAAWARVRLPLRNPGPSNA